MSTVKSILSYRRLGDIRQHSLFNFTHFSLFPLEFTWPATYICLLHTWQDCFKAKQAWNNSFLNRSEISHFLSLDIAYTYPLNTFIHCVSGISPGSHTALFTSQNRKRSFAALSTDRIFRCLSPVRRKHEMANHQFPDRQGAFFCHTEDKSQIFRPRTF